MKSEKSIIGNGAKILIVEDSPTQAKRLKYLLERHGYQTRVATSSSEALLTASEYRPSLVISDLMPGADGYRLCKEIKSQEKLKHVPVVLVTSLSSLQDVIKGLDCGADNFIKKPYGEKELLSRVEYLLTNRELRRRDKVQMGLEICLAGQKHFITSERLQLLDPLISTYEEAVCLNEELKARHKKLARSYQFLNGLYRLAENLNRCTSEDEVVQKTLEHAMKLPGVQAGWVSLREAEAGFRTAAALGLAPALEVSGALEGDCFCRRKLLSGELRQATKILECERLRQARGDTGGLRYHASVPLWVGNRTIGIMNLAGAEQGLFADAELKALDGVANQVRVALERARVLEHLDKTVEERTAALRAEITERVKGEEARGRLASILEATPDLIATADANGRRLYLNEAGRKMLGIGETEDISGMSIVDNRPEWARSLLQNEALPATVRDGAWSGETAFLSGDGREIPVSQVIIAHKTPSGTVEFFSTIARDISERKRLEEQLRQSQKMEAVGRLAGGVAHDFNNLLTVISGYNQLMLSRLDPGDPLHQQADQIKKAAERAASLTQQLLAFSRKQVLQPRVLDLNALVSNLDKMLRRLIGEDIDLVTVLDRELGGVKADPGQIEQVLLNLAVNARDAMPQGGKLTIETANVDLDEGYARRHIAVRPGPYVMLAMSDTGCGMDADTRSRIFEPFFTTKEQGKGTGLGLSTIYGIVKQSGGSIWVYSEPGRGATFKVYLPRVEEAVEAVEPAEGESPDGSETVLLVEDEKAVCEVVREMLEGKGYTVLEARDGDEALLVSERHESTIHLVVTDVVMPGMSGRKLAERLVELHPETKVLYTSGYTDNAIVRQGALEPGTHFLQKPFSADALARKVREVLDVTAKRS